MPRPTSQRPALPHPISHTTCRRSRTPPTSKFPRALNSQTPCVCLAAPSGAGRLARHSPPLHPPLLTAARHLSVLDRNQWPPAARRRPLPSPCAPAAAAAASPRGGWPRDSPTTAAPPPSPSSTSSPSSPTCPPRVSFPRPLHHLGC